LSYLARKFELAPEEIKTATHEGKVYQIGGVYEFSDGGVYWALDSLSSIMLGDTHPFKAEDCEWVLIKETKSKIGTITPAPDEFVDGAAYKFDINGFTALGFYHEDRKSFFSYGNKVCGLSEANDIRLMKVGSE
jgi:hypothetical protein